jgi:hypothetical protein
MRCQPPICAQKTPECPEYVVHFIGVSGSDNRKASDGSRNGHGDRLYDISILNSDSVGRHSLKSAFGDCVSCNLHSNHTALNAFCPKADCVDAGWKHKSPGTPHERIPGGHITAEKMSIPVQPMEESLLLSQCAQPLEIMISRALMYR